MHLTKPLHPTGYKRVFAPQGRAQAGTSNPLSLWDGFEPVRVRASDLSAASGKEDLGKEDLNG